MTDAPVVSVIVPTQALKRRAGLLDRALQSILSQDEVRVVPIVVVNGHRQDPVLVHALHDDPRLQVVKIGEVGLPAALRAGRQHVQTPWFTSLDDDDVLLPGALATRVRALEERPDCAAVVTNGFKRDASGDTPSIPDVDAVTPDPLRAFVRRSWMLPGSWLCRSDGVGPWLFEGMPRFLECTYLALTLARRCTIRFLDAPTVVWHADTPLSESKSPDYAIGQVAALTRILELDLPGPIRAEFRRRLAYARHANAEYYLRKGRLSRAWHWHVRSMLGRNGWQYVPFTRRFVRAALRR